MNTPGKQSPLPLAADALVFNEDFSKLLLIQRGKDPFIGMWAFPGGRIELDELIEFGAKRELEEETTLSDVELHLIDIADRVDRDPRGRNISIIYYGTITNDRMDKVQGGDDAKEAKWFPIHELPELAFDHREVIDRVIKKLGLA
ncbi:NUDIX hydrolase [Patescibacteria group bacterium]|nr:NUDIX hydrolase [Patescibacteria group bacterium]